MRPRLTMIALTAAWMAIAACSSSQQTRYLHKNADLGALKTVAVLPFENLAGDHAAGEKVQKVFYIELLSLDVFDVAEPGQVSKIAHTSEALQNFGPAEYQKLGKDLEVDGLFIGSVVDFADSRTGTTPTPDVTIQLRLIETATGETIWSTSQTRSGAGIGTRLFGVGGESLTEAARRVVREELATLLK